MKRITTKPWKRLALAVLLTGSALIASDLIDSSSYFTLGSAAFARGFVAGGVRAGGARVGAVGGYRGGAYRSVSAGAVVRTGRPVVRPGVVTPRPVYAPTVGGVARRTTRRTIRRQGMMLGSYYYGAPIYALPSAGCVATILEGTSAYICNGVYYVPDYSGDSVVYYPMQ